MRHGLRGVVVGLLLLASPVGAADITGLVFPGSGAGTTRFVFTGANLVNSWPVTYIWRVQPSQQNGYYTSFFWGPTGSFTGAGYYGFHPYPKTPPSGSTHDWEISANGIDYTTDDNANDTTVAYDQWFVQAAVVTESGGAVTMKFYWDLETSPNRVMTYVAAGYASGFPPTAPGLTWGDAPWNPDAELLSGTLRGIQIYAAALSADDIQTEAANQLLDVPQTAAGIAAVWYMAQNPTPTDISDQSGAGHDPAWVGENRPTLFEDVVAGAPPSITFGSGSVTIIGGGGNLTVSH